MQVYYPYPHQLEAMQNIGKASQNRSVHEFEKVSWFTQACPLPWERQWPLSLVAWNASLPPPQVLVEYSVDIEDDPIIQVGLNAA